MREIPIYVDAWICGTVSLKGNHPDHSLSHLRYKDGLKLHPSLRLQVNSTGSLRLLNVNEDHTGVYRCFVDLHTKAKLVRSYSIQVARRFMAGCNRRIAPTRSFGLNMYNFHFYYTEDDNFFIIKIILHKKSAYEELPENYFGPINVNDIKFPNFLMVDS